jgi:Protein of unknown function (DUF2946)
MDDIVKQAMAKWPEVPNVYGWLALDRRGQWRLKGDVVSNSQIATFINRNYEHDSHGRWFFQNGPQRVLVTLEYTPYVYRIVWQAKPGAALHIEAHTGAAVARIASAWIDGAGVILLETEYGIGMLDDRNLDLLLERFTNADGTALDENNIAARLEILQAGGNADLCLNHAGTCTPLHAIAASDVAAKFGFLPRPQTPPGVAICD